MDTLTLNNGKVLEYSTAHKDDDRLYVYIQNGNGLKEIFNLLIKPENVQRIVKQGPGLDDEIFEGYKRLIVIEDKCNGTITAVLKKE
jgi:hypothetical protein